MLINCDFHSHSGYAGGVGQISLLDLEVAMEKKGIDVFGTGDCLHPQWREFLKDNLVERKEGLFSNKDNKARFMLQTEVIFTAAVGSGRKSVHTVILFPSFESVENTCKLLDGMGVKNTIGRPFIKCVDRVDVSNRLSKILDVDDKIEAIPAHVMTPQGVYGSNNPIDKMKDFYGAATERITAVETGLSADPEILSLIPELDDYSLISNSDAHSAALNRMGREFTTVDTTSVSYGNIIDSIRKNKIARTAEFNPTEGRFFLTGHRAGKKGHNDAYCVFSPKYTPKDNKCPICSKKLTIGVLARALQLKEIQGGTRQFGELSPSTKDFVRMVPLVEVIAHSIGVLSVVSVKVVELYEKIIGIFGNEARIWFEKDETIRKKLASAELSDNVIENIIKVKNDDFCFSPPGFDGTYGKFSIGGKEDVFNVNLISGYVPGQKRLF
ncbi:MAG: endonuclease Q family protein [DPANN group archaeon]|nr:endonuclease Q family protein [DPANN group archaeon]